MSLHVPLSVQLITSRGSHRVTRQARDLRFRSTSPGGFASAVVPLDRPLNIQPDDVQLYGRLVVTDGRSGEVVWDGQLEDPSRSAGPDGTVWELTAIGPAGHTRDRTVPLIYVDRRLDPWVTPSYSVEYGEVSRRDEAAIQMRVARGAVMATTDNEIAVAYRALQDAGQEIGRISLAWDAGVTDANLILRIQSQPSLAIEDSDSAATGGDGLAASIGGTPSLTAGSDEIHVQMLRQTSNLAIGNDNTWFRISDIAVRGLLKDAAGADIVTGYDADTVLASEVVADLLGRLLVQFDGPSARIDATTHGIDQLAYPDGINAHDLLNDLMRIEAGYTWHAWERNETTGKHRFEWVQLPTQVRYEAGLTGGYASQGSADGLYDRVRVRWRDPSGVIRTTLRTQTVPELTAAGRSREALIDLGDELGSESNAQRVGEMFLADHAAPPNRGRLTIARPIRDLISGRMVAPWEIRPGNLIRVQGVLPHVDPLNATSRDGLTVFHIASTDFRAADAAAELELDAYSRSTARALADLHARPARRRR